MARSTSFSLLRSTSNTWPHHCWVGFMGLSLSLLLAFLHLGVMLALEPIVARTPDTMNCFASRLGDVNGTRGGSWLEMSTPLVVVDAGNLERVVKMGTKLNETTLKMQIICLPASLIVSISMLTICHAFFRHISHRLSVILGSLIFIMYTITALTNGFFAFGYPGRNPTNGEKHCIQSTAMWEKVKRDTQTMFAFGFLAVLVAIFGALFTAQYIFYAYKAAKSCYNASIGDDSMPLVDIRPSTHPLARPTTPTPSYHTRSSVSLPPYSSRRLSKMSLGSDSHAYSSHPHPDFHIPSPILTPSTSRPSSCAPPQAYAPNRLSAVIQSIGTRHQVYSDNSRPTSSVYNHMVANEVLEMIQRGEVVGSSNDNDMNNRTNSLVDNVTTRNKDTMDDRDNTNPFADPPFADPFADSNPTVNVNSDTSLCSRSPSTSPFGNMTSIRGPRPISQVLMSYEEASGQNRQNGITVQRGVAVTVEGAPRMAMAREDEDWEDIGFGGAAHVGLGDAGDYRKEEEKQTDRKGSDGEGNEKSSK